jgi:hypothetical protein
MEIMGLVMIVVLVTLGFLFAVVFLIGRGESPGLERARLRITAENFVHTFLGSTDPNCADLSNRELVQRCARGRAESCPGGATACVQLQRNLQQILPNTLDLWHPEYHLQLLKSGNEEFSIGQECPGEQILGYQEVPTFGYEVIFQVALCV